MNLRPYNVRPTGQRPEGAMYKNIPMSELENVKSFLRGKGITFRIRYRGPRSEFSDIRPKHRRMQDCLKRFANRFSVYLT